MASKRLSGSRQNAYRWKRRAATRANQSSCIALQNEYTERQLEAQSWANLFTQLNQQQPMQSLTNAVNNLRR